MIQPSAETEPAYEEHLRRVHRHVRDAMAALLASVGADPTLPQEISRRFGLNHTTAWKVCKIIQEADPHTLIQHMPGPSGAKILLRAIQKQGAPEERVVAARQALAEFERMIRVHAGDRPTLERMAASQSTRAARQQREAHRKLSFRGNSCTWGVQAGVHLMASFVAPSETPGMVDYVKVGGLLDFRRLRPDAVWPLITTTSWNDEDDAGKEAPREEPLDPEGAGAEGLPLLREFCSQPIPALRRRASGALQVFELDEGPVGMTGATSCVFGLVTRRLGSYLRSPSNRYGAYGSFLSTPAELYLGDVFIHRDLAFALELEPVLSSRLGAEGGLMPGREPLLLPLDEELTRLGCPADVTTPEIPNYPRLVQYVFDRMGWDADAFHGQRLRLSYPPIPASLVFRHELLDPER